MWGILGLQGIYALKCVCGGGAPRTRLNHNKHSVSVYMASQFQAACEAHWPHATLPLVMREEAELRGFTWIDTFSRLVPATNTLQPAQICEYLFCSTAVVLCLRHAGYRVYRCAGDTVPWSDGKPVTPQAHKDVAYDYACSLTVDDPVEGYFLVHIAIWKRCKDREP
jgi:hypothetical protein